MNSFFEKSRNFFSAIWIKIKSFFTKFSSALKKVVYVLNLKVNSLFEKIVQKKNEFFRNTARKRTEKKILRQLKEEEKARERSEKRRKRNEAAEKRSEMMKSAEIKFFRGFMNVLDVFFDTVFSCGVIFCLRPELLAFSEFPFLESFEFDSFKIGIFAKFSETPEITNSMIFIICCLFSAYLLLKIVFSVFMADGINKLISVMLTVITLVSVTLIKDKFLIFFVLYILLFVTFQFSCGLNFETIKLKLFCFILLSFISYTVILYIFDGLFRDGVILILEEMSLPITLL